MLEVNKNSIVFRLARHLCSSTPLVGERDTLRGNTIEISLYLLASERSERDTIRGNSIEISLYLFIYLSVYGVRETSVFARAFNYVS